MHVSYWGWDYCTKWKKIKNFNVNILFMFRTLLLIVFSFFNILITILWSKQSWTYYREQSVSLTPPEQNDYGALIKTYLYHHALWWALSGSSEYPAEPAHWATQYLRKRKWKSWLLPTAFKGVKKEERKKLTDLSVQSARTQKSRI